jgi:hypothetical protein
MQSILPKSLFLNKEFPLDRKSADAFLTDTSLDAIFTALSFYAFHADTLKCSLKRNLNSPLLNANFTDTSLDAIPTRPSLDATSFVAVNTETFQVRLLQTRP